jgi:uncharacterized protein YlxP (DUF503 family)
VENLVVGVARFALRMPANRSLKEKRKVVRRVRDRVRSRHNVSVSEIGDQDEARRAVFALGMVGSDGRHVESSLRAILDAIEDLHLAPMVERTIEVETWGDDLAGLGPPDEYEF